MNVAVGQIIVLAVFATVGMTLRQIPDVAYRNPADYATQVGLLHDRYDALLGSAVVDLLERIGAFGVFRSWWFSAALVLLLVSIVVCTLDRTPRLWRQSHGIRVAQPEPFFDPRLPDRALTDGLSADDVATVLRRHRFGVRRAAGEDGTAYVYGDRHRYTKLATLITHAGLILFLVAAAVTSRFGFEAPLVVANGDTSTVQPIGTPGLLVVKNLGFQAPRRPDGAFADFTTDLAVYRDGREIAHKTIRVNDPLSVAGFTFHQNGFGSAPELVIRDGRGEVLWSGPVAMTDAAGGRPYTSMAVPGRDLGLELFLDRGDDGVPLLLMLPYRVIGANPDGSPQVETYYPFVVEVGATGRAPGLDLTVELPRIGAYTLLIAKQDPGQGLVWLAFALLLTGLVITFYLPRRRVWARLDPAGRVALHFRGDRYVDVEREFGRLLDDLVALRRAAGQGAGGAPPPSAGEAAAAPGPQTSPSR